MKTNRRRSFLLASAIALLACAPGISAQENTAQSTQAPASIWQDIMTATPTETPDGSDMQATNRMIERCAELMLSIRERRDGGIRGYRMSYGGGYCLGWINAMMTSFPYYGENRPAAQRVCLPADVTSRQVAEVFLDYTDAHADLRKFNPAVLIYWALLEKYPCAS